jgi:hypothetical protein
MNACMKDFSVEISIQSEKRSGKQVKGNIPFMFKTETQRSRGWRAGLAFSWRAGLAFSWHAGLAFSWHAGLAFSWHAGLAFSWHAGLAFSCHRFETSRIFKEKSQNLTKGRTVVRHTQLKNKWSRQCI